MIDADGFLGRTAFSATFTYGLIQFGRAVMLGICSARNALEIGAG